MGFAVDSFLAIDLDAEVSSNGEETIASSLEGNPMTGRRFNGGPITIKKDYWSRKIGTQKDRETRIKEQKREEEKASEGRPKISHNSATNVEDQKRKAPAIPPKTAARTGFRQLATRSCQPRSNTERHHI